MAAVLLQQNKAAANSATSLPCTFNSAVTPGSLLIVYAGSPASTRTFTASDGTNGSYNIDIANNGGSGSMAILSFPNTASGTPTVTLVMSGAVNQMVMLIEEWSGIQQTTPFDKSATFNIAAATTATVGPTATLSATNELCVAAVELGSNAGSSPTFAVQSPWTPDPVSPVSNGANVLLAAGYFLPGASTSGVSATFNWQISLNGRAALATYKSIPAAVSSQAGGTGSSQDEEEPRERRRILKPIKPNPNLKKASQVFREEMEKLENNLQAARADREEIDKVSAKAGTASVPLSVQRFILEKERRLNREKSIHAGVAVYYQAARDRRLSAIERLQRLARIARYREQVAEEALRKVKERIDEDSAVAFMQALMREWS